MLSNRTRCRIQNLFLRRLDSYCLHDASRLVGVPPQELIDQAESDDPDAYRKDGAWHFTWRQLAYVAVRRWPLAEIHDALGADATTVLPPLLAPRTVTVRLPEYLLRAMEAYAAAEATTLDDWLCRELVDFAGTVVDRMELILPGYRRAYLFPGLE